LQKLDNFLSTIIIWIYLRLGEGGAYNVLGEYYAAPLGGKKIGIRKDTSSVILNYLMLAKDRSNGAHNPANTIAMLAAMKAFLGIQ
jgi:hypothetical protein